MKNRSLRSVGLKKSIVYIVRHGQTEWNMKKMIQGQKDSPLTDIGISQAKELAENLKKIKFDFIFSSDLLRAKRTAEIIAAEHKLNVETTQLLRERAFGQLEGKTIYALKAFEELFTKLEHEEIFNYKSSPEMESDNEITNRMMIFLREAVIANAGKKILVVTHGGIMRAFLIKLGVADYKNPIFVGNAGYIKLKTDGIDFEVKEIKDIHGKQKNETIL